jgi:Fe-S-cluster containining protein
MSIREIRVRVSCDQCTNKCCSQPYDWVYLTEDEIVSLEIGSGLGREEFVTTQKNPVTGFTFQTLNLPCRFLDPNSGACTVYAHRPLVCRTFPFYPEPLTGYIGLLPAQCGSNLDILPIDGDVGWALDDFRDDIKWWMKRLWREAEPQR